jgi:hypothetical protein
MNPVILVVSHGVEDKEISDSYADPLINNIKSFMTDDEQWNFHTVILNWTKKTQYRQNQLFKQCDEGLPRDVVRKLKYTIGGDLIAYQRTRNGNGFFEELHREIDNLIEFKLNGLENAKIALLGHSLGSQVLYNHLFQTKLETKPNGIFVIGSPFALYSVPYENYGSLPPYPIDFFWNFYIPDDWISSKIQKVHPNKDIAVFVKDYEVPINYFNPKNWLQKLRVTGGLISHLAYWQNKYVAKTIAKQLVKLMQ